MHNAKMSILQLILDDRVRALENKAPVNKQHILDEFTDYEKAGGNHYVKSVVEDYIEWEKDYETK